MTETLSYYHIFYEVAKCKNFSKASKTLFISQPAISRAIRKLENSLHVTLFQRSSRGVQLTQEGQILYEHVCTAFDAIGSGELAIKKMQSLETGLIRIGVSTTLCKYLLLPYLQNFIHAFPHIKISIFCQSTNHTLDLLEDGRLDIGLIGKPESAHAIVFRPILTIQDTFVGSPSYLKNLSLSDDFFYTTEKMPHSPQEIQHFEHQIFDHATILLLDKENMSRQYIDDYLSLNHMKPAHLLEISTMDLLIEFAKIGLGVACVIQNFVEQELLNKNLIEIPLNIPIHSREVGFAYSQKSILSKASEQFLASSFILSDK